MVARRPITDKTLVGKGFLRAHTQVRPYRVRGCWGHWREEK